MNRRLYYLAYGLPLLIAGVFCVTHRGYELDDALIYARYVQNLLDGHGLVYNVGSYFNGLTSPLYAALLAALSLLSGKVLLSAWIISSLSFLGGLVLWMRVFEEEAGLEAACLGGLLTASYPYFYGTFGMETPLYFFLMGACLRCWQRQRWQVLAWASGLLLLARSESIFLLAAMALTQMLKKKPWPGWKLLLAPCLLLGAAAVFNRAYFGDWLPQTLSAKLDQGRSGLWGEGLWKSWPIFLNLHYQTPSFGKNYPVMICMALAAGLGAWRLKESALGWALGGFLLFSSVFYAGLNIPPYHWYYAPYYAVGFALAGVGIAHLRPRIHWIIPAALALILLGQGLRLSASYRDGENPYRAIGLWVKEHTLANSSMAEVEVGTLGWYSCRPTIDILGLVSAGNSKLLGQRRFDAWTELYSPDYILAHEPLWIHEQSIPKLVKSGRYQETPGFKFPGFHLYQKRLS